MGDLIPIGAAPSLRDKDTPTIIDTEGNALESARPAPEGYQRGGDMIEQRVKLTRREFEQVAQGTYPAGQTPEHGGPVIIDKRGRNNARAAEHAAERQARAEQLAAQRTWARQAAGTLWWSAQGEAQRGNTVLAERTLAKRAELVAGAQARGIL